MDIPEDAVNETIRVLGDHFELGGYAKVGHYIWEGQTPTQREDALRRLKEADEAALLKVRNAVIEALQAGIEKFPGLCSGCKEIVSGTFCGYCIGDE